MLAAKKNKNVVAFIKSPIIHLQAKDWRKSVNSNESVKSINMPPMKWANEPYRGRLRAEQMDVEFIRFADEETGGAVTAYVPEGDFAAVTMTVISDLVESPFTGLSTFGIDQAKHFIKGEGITERDVWHFVTREHCQVLRAGLTVHCSVFSSMPHRFEMSPVKGFEEVFHFLIPPADDEGGDKGILEGCGLWPDGRPVDALWPVFHRCFAQVPMGWHRVVMLPSAEGGLPRLGYIWCYLALEGRGWEKD